MKRCWRLTAPRCISDTRCHSRRTSRDEREVREGNPGGCHHDGINDLDPLSSPLVVGLRGSANELADLARRYRVAYTATKGPPYEVMHSNAVFFFDRDGRARLVTTDTTDTAAMADDVKRLLN